MGDNTYYNINACRTMPQAVEKNIKKVNEILHGPLFKLL